MATVSRVLSPFSVIALLFALLQFCLLGSGVAHAAEQAAPYGEQPSPCTSPLQIGTTAASSLRGSGTQQDPYIVSSPSDLAAIGQNLGACYALGSDVDLKGLSFAPIGSASTPFTGSLDGRGHSIKNFTSYSPSSTTASREAGIFAHTSKAQFKNMSFTGVNVNLTVLRANNSARVGILSLNDASSTFQGIKLSGKMKLNASIVEAGGLVCTAKGSQVKNVSSSIAIDYSCDKRSIVGGIVCVSNGATIQGCSNAGSITNKDGLSASGGILGSGYNRASTATVVSNCTNSGSMTGCYSAGIASNGHRYYCTVNVTGCRNSGAVTAVKPGEQTGEASGILSSAAGSVANCVNSGKLWANYTNGRANGISSSHEISRCENVGSIIAGYAAGIGGNDSRSSVQDENGTVIEEDYLHISNCVNRGYIEGEVAQGIGGFVTESCVNYGNLKGKESAFGITWDARYVTDCKNFGNLFQDQTKAQTSTANQSAAGIAEKVAKRTVSSYNYGSVTGRNACGVVRSNNGEIAECYNAGAIKATGFAGGITEKNADFVDNCYNVGNVSGDKAGGIVVSNNRYGVVTNCYNVGAVDGKSACGAIAVDNANNVINSYYFNGTRVGVGTNKTGARDTTKALANGQLTKQGSYKAFDFRAAGMVTTMAAGQQNSGGGIWVMSPKSKMPRLARMSDKDEVYIKNVAVKSRPAASVMGKAVKRTDIKLLVTYSNNKKATISSGFTLGAYKKSLGKRTIAVHFAGKKVTFKTTFAPAAPSKVTVRAHGRNVSVQFKKAAKAKGYEIFRSTKAKSGFKKVKTIKAGKPLSFTDRKLKGKKTYYYKVRSTSGKYKGVFGKVYRVKTK